MLPDFHTLKLKHWNETLRYLQVLTSVGDPIFSDRKRYIRHEGKDMTYQTVDGQIKQPQMNEAKYALKVEPTEIPHMTQVELNAKLLEMLKNVHEQLAKAFFKYFSEVTDEVGNVVNAKGRPFDFNMLFDELPGLQIDFNENEQPIMPTLFMHPDMLDKIKKKFIDSEKNSEYHRRYSKWIEKKREEWRDREINRKLVD